MKIRKKLTAVFLAILTVVLTAPVTVSAAYADNFEYRIENGEAIVTGCNEALTGDLIIPETLDGYPVTRIDDYAFEFLEHVASVTIPDSVTAIGSFAFQYCTELRSVIIPQSVVSIEDSIFGGCGSLESITVHGDNPVYDSRNNCCAIIETASDKLIQGCVNTVIPDGVEAVGDYAFYSCTNIADIKIPDSVTAIGDYAFYYCFDLENIVIPDSVTAVGNEAFGSCGNLQNVIYSGTQDDWNSILISSDNEYLTESHIHYSVPAEEADTHLTTEIIKEATCETDGEKFVSCACGYSYTQTVPARGHDGDYVETVEPTCTQSGFTVYHCAKCGEIYYDDYIDAVGHNFVNDSCSVCGKAIKTISSGDIAQVEAENETDMECFKFIPPENGTYYFYSDSTENTYGYLYDSNMNLIASDDDGAGECNFLISYDFEKGKTYYLGAGCYSDYAGTFHVLLAENFESRHSSEIIDEAAPTCTEKGFTEYKCSVCGETYYAYSDALGHDFADGYCTRCLKSEPAGISVGDCRTVSIENYDEPVLLEFIPEVSGRYYFYADSNSDTRGYLYDSKMNLIMSDDDGADDDCNFLISYDFESGKTYYLAADSWGDTGSFNVSLTETFESCHCYELLGIVDPTCENSGYSIYRCSVCGYDKRTDYVESFGHSKSAVLEKVAPSCTKKGYTVYECATCGMIFYSDYVDALRHNFEGDYCTNCAKRVKTICSGDVLAAETENEESNDYFRFIPQESGMYYFYSDSANDTYCSLYDSSMNLIDSDDDGAGECSFLISYYFEGGETYYFEAECLEGTDSFYVLLSEEFNSCHTKGEILKQTEPTCSGSGKVEYICSVCGRNIKETVEPTGHHFIDGICSVCGVNANDAVAVSFNSDEGYCEQSGKTVYLNDIYGELPLAYDFYEEKVFAGWYTSDGKRITADSKVEISSDHELKAGWVYIDWYDEYIYGENLLSITKEELAEYVSEYMCYTLWHPIGCTFETTVTGDYDRIGTGSMAEVEDYGEIPIIIFGDVNGDGWYDGMDSVIVNCIVNGLLTHEQVGDYVWLAADCNHDGVIDSADAELLEQAGLMLADVDQSASPDELAENSAYAEYISLIDQNYAPKKSAEEAQADTAPADEPAAYKSVIQKITDCIICFIVKLIKEIFGADLLFKI